MMATTQAAVNGAEGRELTTAGIFKGAALGGLAGAIGNVLLHVMASAGGVSLVAEFAKGQPPGALAAPHVVMASVVPALFAALFTLVVNRFSSRPTRLLLGVAVALGLLSMGGPATLPGASSALRVVLALMHVVSGVSITAGIVRLGRRA